MKTSLLAYGFLYLNWWLFLVRSSQGERSSTFYCVYQWNKINEVNRTIHFFFFCIYIKHLNNHKILSDWFQREIQLILTIHDLANAIQGSSPSMQLFWTKPKLLTRSPHALETAVRWNTRFTPKGMESFATQRSQLVQSARIRSSKVICGVPAGYKSGSFVISIICKWLAR